MSSLTLEQNGDHPIELVIDSTGFAGVIINKALGEPFDELGHYLPNDRAAVVQIPHEDGSRIDPVSRAIGMKCGWRFIVPLYNRIGTGYVYSSQLFPMTKPLRTQGPYRSARRRKRPARDQNAHWQIAAFLGEKLRCHGAFKRLCGTAGSDRHSFSRSRRALALCASARQ